MDLVRFHRAVVQRAEEGFWALDGRDAESERWTSLEHFVPQHFDGAWPLGTGDMRSAAWRRQLERAIPDVLYLGGPGYLGRASSGGASAPCWHPLFYREVQIADVEGGVELRPVSDEWLLSPPVHQLLERLQLRPELDADALSARIAAHARAAHGRDGAPVPLALLEAAFAVVPELRDHLRLDPGATFATPPSAWVLFAPPTRIGPYNQHLVRDYEAMQRHLGRAPAGDVGGLSLLRPSREPVAEREAEVLPFIPLNAAQERAVAAMLAGRPVTVVSGPPGCGKSQVVVSLLLNAWAQGQSVLFASNNNKAVDVVRERLRPFDAELPVSVRAGSANVNTVATTLRRVAQAAGNHVALRTDVATVRCERDALRRERREVLSLLDGRVPQRIAESLEAALRAHGEQLTIRAGLAAREAAHLQRLYDAVGAALDAEQATTLLQETRRWLAHVTELRVNVITDSADHARHAADVERAGGAVAAALARAGVDRAQLGTPDAWDALDALHRRLADWLREARLVLREPTMQELVPGSWDPAYERWSSPETAAATAHACTALAADVDTRSAPLPDVLRRAVEAQEREEAAWRSLQEVGWPEHRRTVTLDGAAVDEWLAVWARYITVPAGLFGLTGALARRPLRAQLRQLESRFHDEVPLEAWRRIGPLDDQARDRLADVLERARRHREAYDRSGQAACVRNELAAALAPLVAVADGQGLPGITDPLDPARWAAASAAAVQRAGEAAAAAAAWRVRLRHEAAVGAVRALGAEWCALVRGARVLAPWLAGHGAEAGRAFASLAEEPGIATAERAASALASRVGDELCEALGDALDAERQRADAARRRDAVPGEADRIAQAWNARPEPTLPLERAGSAWPDVGAYDVPLAGLDAWLAGWRHFADVERPAALGRAARERSVAVERLLEAVALLPDTSDGEEARVRAHAILNDAGVDWPIDELRRRFIPFLPERLHLRLAALDDALSRTAMDEARSRWAERLGREVAALNAVDRLQQAAGPNGQGDLAPHPEHFRRALAVVPVWITTAQSTRAIPLVPELFDLVVIDEASQCTLTNLLPMLFRARRLVVIGDPQQLPAITVVQSSEERALARQFGVSEFVPEFGHDRRDVYTVAREALPGGAADVVMLDEHYRSDPLIIGFANRHVYQHQLWLRRAPGRRLADGVEPGVHRVHVAGEAWRPSGGSWVNEREAAAVVDRVRALCAAGVAPDAIGVVTPFTGQKLRLRALLEAAGISVLVDTAFGFQGDERDVIVFSPVVAPGMQPASVHWVEQPPNLLNVALTRARDALFVVADFDHCREQRGLLRDLARYLDDVDALRGSHPAELALFGWMTMEGWTPAVHEPVGRDRVTFALAGRPGVRVAVVVRPLSHAESPRTTEERAREAALQAAGYRVVGVIARDVLETPAGVMQRLREAM